MSLTVMAAIKRREDFDSLASLNSLAWPADTELRLAVTDPHLREVPPRALSWAARSERIDADLDDALGSHSVDVVSTADMVVMPRSHAQRRLPMAAVPLFLVAPWPVRRVLVAGDVSDSLQGLETVCRWGLLSGLDVRVVKGGELPLLVYAELASALGGVMETEMVRASHVAALLRTHGVTTDTIVRAGNRWLVLADVARQFGGDLVVMPQCSDSGLSRFLGTSAAPLLNRFSGSLLVLPATSSDRGLRARRHVLPNVHPAQGPVGQQRHQLLYGRQRAAPQ